MRLWISERDGELGELKDEVRDEPDEYDAAQSGECGGKDGRIVVAHARGAAAADDPADERN